MSESDRNLKKFVIDEHDERSDISYRERLKTLFRSKSVFISD